MIKKYNIGSKCVVTSFMFECIRRIKEYAPELRVGWLVETVEDETTEKLKLIGGEEICPAAEVLTPEKVEKWHKEGLNVRAWGVANEELMKKAYECGVNGMTVNFPDKLRGLLWENY